MSDDEGKARGGRIENNGIQVLKDMSDEDIAGISYIENNGVLVVPRKLLAKLAGKRIENNGILVPFEEGMRFYSGSTRINASFLEALDAPLEAVQAGKMIFEDDVTPELVKSKIKDIRNYGIIVAPDHIRGVVTAKVSENFGKVARPGENGHRHDHHHGCDHDHEE